MILKLRKENKKLRDDQDDLRNENEELEEDKLDLLLKMKQLENELKQCHAIITRHHEERRESKNN
eukprot:COSAG02_NODE_415_length_22762_cov_133.681816_18_plen_65_part_00